MRQNPLWRRYLRFLGSDPAADVDEELDFHLQMRAEELARGGLSAEGARARAAREFGDVERVRAEMHEIGRRRLRREGRARAWGSMGQDVRLAFRTLRRSPGFAAVAVLTLALGVGATIAIFTVVSGVLLKPLPYPDADRVLTLWQDDRTEGLQEVAPANFLDWRERSRSFGSLAAIEPFSVDHAGAEGPESIPAWLVTEGFFEALGTSALLGRTIAPDEYGPGVERVVVLGYGLWQSRFAADPGIVGRTLLLDGAPASVVGVMPPEFGFPAGRELWAPKVFTERDLRNRTSAYYQVVGRLRPGVTREAARLELAAIAEELAREHPATLGDVGIAPVPLRESLVGRVRPALLVLFGAVGFVLLIACVNVASLMLVRAVARERDFALRAALGAGRRRVVRQLLVENAVVGVLGGAMALLAAYGGIRVIRAVIPPTVPRAEAIAIDHRVLAFALFVSLGTAVLFGLAPALHLARADLQARLRAGGHAATAGPGARRIRGALVVGQIAIAVVLLIGAGLLVRSFAALLRVERGYRTEDVLAVTVQAWQYHPTPPQRAAFVQEMVERLGALPGVHAAGVTSSLPLAEGIGLDVAGFELQGAPAAAPDEMRTAHGAAVTTGYFHALGIALRSGRLFGASDDAAGPAVVVVNEAMARRYWPGESPLGKRLTVRFGGPPTLREVVGVVADVRHAGPHDEPRPALYVPHAQSPTGALTFVVHTAGDPRRLLGAVRGEIWALNPTMPLAGATTLDELLSESLLERRFNLLLLLSFSAVSLALAAVGVYGLLSHEASRRAREIGVRMALGARRRRVLALVLGAGMRMGLVGIALGVCLALGLTRLLEAFLFGVSATDPLTYAGIAAILLLVTIAASYLPARRAMRVDPAVALRAD